MITYNHLSDHFKILPIQFFTVCDKHIQETIKRPDGDLNFHQILFVIDGKGLLKCNGNTYELKKGSAFFTAIGVPVEYINTGGLVTAFLTATGTAVADLMECFSCDGFLFYESINVEAYISAIRKITDEYYEHKRAGLLSAMVYSFYINFFEQQNHVFTKLDEVALYIEKNYMKKLTLAQLANIGCFSVSKLCHDFKKRLGCSVFQYVLNIRLTNARYFLMSDHRASVKDASISCGFDDVSYFCRAYKNKFGKSPAKDRENHFA